MERKKCERFQRFLLAYHGYSLAIRDHDLPADHLEPYGGLVLGYVRLLYFGFVLTLRMWSLCLGCGSDS